MKYKEMVHAYTLLWRNPMSFYTVIMQAAVFFLIPAAILLIGRTGNAAVVIADFCFLYFDRAEFHVVFNAFHVFSAECNDCETGDR
jgi:hypothetical protein